MGNLTIIGQVHPRHDFHAVRPRNDRPILEGVPPNMSVRSSTAVPVLDRADGPLHRVVNRLDAHVWEMSTATTPSIFPTMITAARTSFRGESAVGDYNGSDHLIPWRAGRNATGRGGRRRPLPSLPENIAERLRDKRRIDACRRCSDAQREVRLPFLSIEGRRKSNRSDSRRRNPFRRAGPRT